MVSMNMKKCSISLVIMKMKTKTIVWNHLSYIRMAILKKEKRKITRVGKEIEKLEPYIVLVGM